jgi:type I restriction enzyme S subunit
MAFRVPVPPLEVQREIVKVLDAFTKLEAELEAELEARRRQYEHYRDQLLTFPGTDGVRRTPMGELTVAIASGKNKQRADEGRYPVYGSTGLLGYCDHAAYSGDALLIARVGANAGLVNVVGGDFDVSDNTLVVRPTLEWNVRFAFHQLTKMRLNQHAVGGGQPLITGRLLKSLEITLPPLDEQRRIARVLDTFDALVNDLSIGLPAELNARRKQYEHYRDRLLTFREAA